MLFFTFAGLAISTLVYGKEVTDVFTDVTGVTSSGARWVYYRRANVKWAIRPGQLQAGDTFTLSTPCLQPFDDFNLAANGHTYAICKSTNNGTAESVAALCTATDFVTGLEEAFGTVSIPIYLGVGGLASDLWYSLAKCSHKGVNQVRFSHGDKQWQYNNNLDTTDNVGRNPVESWAVTLTGLKMAYAMEKKCANGYTSGQLKLALTRKIDCNSVTYGMTSDLNEFFFPKSGESIPGATISCSNSEITLKYNTIPSGYRPFIWTNFDSAGTRVITQTGTYTCVGTTKAQSSRYQITHSTVGITKYTGSGTEVVNATTIWKKSMTSTTTLLRNNQMWTRLFEIPSSSSITSSSISIIPSFISSQSTSGHHHHIRPGAYTGGG